MGRHAQIVVGPAGSGKSTYCKYMAEYLETLHRTVHVINLDPAAEEFKYHVTADIRDLITLDDVMDELEYGPNGGLVYCMEYLMENFEWMEDVLGDYDEDYIIFDCPGQVELYTHIPIMREFAKRLQDMGYFLCAVYVLDSHFICEPAKFMSGALSCLSTMTQLEIPHISVLSKIDILGKNGSKSKLRKFLKADTETLLTELNEDIGENFYLLNRAMADLIQEYSLVGFIPFNIDNPNSISIVSQHIDTALQYGEDAEVREKENLGDEDEDGDNDNEDGYDGEFEGRYGSGFERDDGEGFDRSEGVDWEGLD